MVNILALHAVPVEWRMNMRTGECKKRILDDRIGEFPIVNLDYAAKKTRWSYHVAMSSDQLQKFKGLFKYDLETGAALEHMFEPGIFGSEPAYAPRINAKSEDDGYVIVFVTNENTGASEAQDHRCAEFREGAGRARATSGACAGWLPRDLGPRRSDGRLMSAFIYDAVRTPRGKARPDGGLAALKPQELVGGLIGAIGGAEVAPRMPMR
jgi:hypothetical protein